MSSGALRADMEQFDPQLNSPIQSSDGICRTTHCVCTQCCQSQFASLEPCDLAYICWINLHKETIRAKSGYFGHQVNSDIHLQTVDIQMRRLPYGPFHQDFHCLLNYFIQKFKE